MKGPLETGFLGLGRWDREKTVVEAGKAKLEIRGRSHDLQLSSLSSGSLHLHGNFTAASKSPVSPMVRLHLSYRNLDFKRTYSKESKYGGEEG